MMGQRAVIAAVLGLSGCLLSHTLDGPAADYSPERHGEPDCDREGSGRLGLDLTSAVLAAGFGWVGVLGLASSLVESAEVGVPTGVNAVGLAALGGGLAAVPIWSYQVGNRRVRRCNRAWRAYQRTKTSGEDPRSPPEQGAPPR